ncbi:general secretion pathway protein J [Yersinia rohdei]|uniref:General secretion pathway protein J n=2 Tax=Yersinia rohdei TaxID=29485 RepID=A0A0U1HWU6_YERRO|nr:general secretion pathway protein J [Yersinia rohdei]CNI85646.1 general secretion pathway protein J [Yersinia rohdei]CQI95709.1 general secretion pathway protein J [Yersinia rohdei]
MDTSLFMSKRLDCGYTLLEILLSAIVFTLMSMTIYQSLMIVIKGSDVVSKKTRKNSQLQRAINIMEDNISHAVMPTNLFAVSPLDSNFKIDKHLLDSDDYGIYLLFNSETNIVYHAQVEIVGFRLKNKQLEILRYNLTESIPRASKILAGVTAFHIRIFHDGIWIKKWNNKLYLPKAVEFTLELEGIGTIRRVIILLNSTN